MTEVPRLSTQRLAEIRLVVIGASAGGVEALQRTVAQFDGGLRTAVAIVLHLPAGATSYLPQILGRRSRVPAAHAVDGESLEPGRIYISPPDVHLLVDADGHVNLNKGPRENNHRPAIDPLFRSAIEAFGPAVTAVVLSGTLDDGAAGLAAVSRGGGITAVQSLDDALFSAMPRAALAATTVDVTGSAGDIGRFIRTLGSDGRSAGVGPRPARGGNPERPATSTSSSTGVAVPDDEALEVPSKDPDRPPSRFTCPDCHGSLWLLEETEGPRRYRCRVGHAWSEVALAERQGVELENALWMAMRLMDERLELFHKMRGDASRHGPASRTYRWLSDRIAALQQNAEVLRRVLAELPPGGGAVDS